MEKMEKKMREHTSVHKCKADEADSLLSVSSEKVLGSVSEKRICSHRGSFAQLQGSFGDLL